MPPMTAREYQQLLCPACGNRKLPEHPLCSKCRLRQQSRISLCPQCQRPKPAHYALCDACQVESLMACPQGGRRKKHPEQPLCSNCYAERKYGEKARCSCPCNCGNYKTKPRAPVCGICWQQGHYHNPPDFSDLAAG